MPYSFYGYIKRENDEKVGKLFKYLLASVRGSDIEPPTEIEDLADDYFDTLDAFEEEYDVHIVNRQ